MFKITVLFRESSSRKMGSLMENFKRQASIFFGAKIKTARLLLTDVTPAQLLTEEVIDGDSWPADCYAMRRISRAAFEVDDYERIVHILHHRLSKFDTCNWRVSYKALRLLEHLLTLGPLRIAEEFETDQQFIRDMATFHYVDDKGFDWGSCAREKSERIVKLIEDRSYLKEERLKARRPVVGFEGSKSFRATDVDGSSKETNSDGVLRSNSLSFGDHHQRRHHDAAVECNLLASDEHTKLLVINKKREHDDLCRWSHADSTHEYVMEEDHPFWDKKHQTRVPLLSST